MEGLKVGDRVRTSISEQEQLDRFFYATTCIVGETYIIRGVRGNIYGLDGVFNVSQNGPLHYQDVSISMEHIIPASKIILRRKV